MIRTYAWEPGADGIECVEAFGVTTNGERVVAYTTQSGRTDLAPWRCFECGACAPVAGR